MTITDTINLTSEFDNKSGVNALVQKFYENTGIKTLVQSYGIGLDGSIVKFDGHNADTNKLEDAKTLTDDNTNAFTFEA